MFTLVGHESFVKSNVITSDGASIYSGSIDKTVKKWDYKDKDSEIESTNLISKVDALPITSIAISKNSKLFAIGCINKKIILRVINKKKHDILEGHKSAVNSVVFSHDDKYLISSSKDSTIIIWGIDEKEIKSTLRGHSKSVKSVCISYNNEFIVSGSDDRLVKV